MFDSVCFLFCKPHFCFSFCFSYTLSKGDLAFDSKQKKTPLQFHSRSHGPILLPRPQKPAGVYIVFT